MMLLIVIYIHELSCSRSRGSIFWLKCIMFPCCCMKLRLFVLLRWSLTAREQSRWKTQRHITDLRCFLFNYHESLNLLGTSTAYQPTNFLQRRCVCFHFQQKCTWLEWMVQVFVAGFQLPAMMLTVHIKSRRHVLSLTEVPRAMRDGRLRRKGRSPPIMSNAISSSTFTWPLGSKEQSVILTANSDGRSSF